MSTADNGKPDELSIGNIQQVVAEPLRFKAKLAIGENAYASLRAVNKIRELWDVLGAAGTGAAVAKSSLIATSFFAPSGLLGLLGIGTAATPIGWVAFAAMASGGACYGMYRWLGNSKGDRVIEIPKFLNTPLDALGLALFDLIAPIALRLAAVDGQVESEERDFLIEHLVAEWGLDRDFVRHAIGLIEANATDGSLSEMTEELANFLHANSDCNQQVIAAELAEFMRDLLAAGGPLTPLELDALKSMEEKLLASPNSDFQKYWALVKSNANQTSEKITNKAKKVSHWAQEELLSSAHLGKASTHMGHATELAQRALKNAGGLMADGVQNVKKKMSR